MKRKNETPKQKPKRQQDAFSTDLQTNLQTLRNIYADCSDVIFRTFLIGGKTAAAIIFIDGMCNIEETNREVLSPLMHDQNLPAGDAQALLDRIVPVMQATQVQTVSQSLEQVLAGCPLLLVDQLDSGISLGLPKFDKRGIEEPSAEPVVRGPRDGFTETLNTNTSLLRRKLKSPALKMKSLKVGRYSQTKIIVAYIEGLADNELIAEAVNRINRIQIDGVLESGYLEEFIEDDPSSPFPQVLATERPDVAAASLLEGRIVILTDGTPFALIAPVSLYSMLQSAEDYYHRYLIGTLIRWLRYGFLLIALLLPSAYVALLTFHQEMVPSTLLLSIAKSREAIPFPALVEALIMEVTFEALREAGIRLPKQIGAAVSIVGALVIGQAAVSAGLVSAPMVMVVAITGIASFSIPRYSAAIAFRMLRFPIMFLAGTLGLLGIMLGLIAIIVHLASLRSFGVPYLSPMAPMKRLEMHDVLWRAPWWIMRTRPHLTSQYDKFRQPPGQKPDPAKGSE
ncbi:MAG TPA: spore germination protein [Bacilli bacterium]